MAKLLFTFGVMLLALFDGCQMSHGLTTFHRGNKIAETFKKVSLAPEEIDPSLAQGTGQLQELQLSDNVGQELVSDTDPTNNNEITEELDEQPVSLVPVELTASETPVPSTTIATVQAAVTPVKNEDDAIPINKFCKCTDTECDCCRNFGLPIVPVRGPACARISYLGNEKMSVSLKYGDIVLATRTISGKKARPVCMPLFGGYSQFCGRVYGLARAKEDFKACLGFELRADDEVEAALRVSCFKFGPKGLRVAEAEPMPSETQKDEEDDDDDGVFGFGGADDEYDEEDDDGDDDDDTDDEDEDDDDDDDDDDDETANDDAEYGGFSFLLDELTESGEAAAAAAAAATTADGSPTTTTTTTTTQNTRNVEQNSSKKTTEASGSADGVDLKDSTTIPVTAADSTGAAATAVSDESSTIKSKKSSKSKKNKKKKASDADYALDIINGILDFFN